MVRVDRRDLIVDTAPPTKFDLITCRNLLIYLDRDAQDLIFKKFHDALEPDGILMLGKVETMLGAARTLFSSVHSRSRMFKKAT